MKLYLFLAIIVAFIGASRDVFMGIHDHQQRFDMMQSLVDEWTIDASIRIDYSPEKGIHVVANKDLNESERVVGVPERYLMSVNDNFPFKETYINAITQIPWIRNVVGNPSLFIIGTIVQICQMLVNLNTNRQEIEEAIDGYSDFDLYVENWTFWRNYLYSMPDVEAYDTPVVWDEQDVKYFKEINYGFLNFRNMSFVYDELLEILEKTRTPEATFLKEKVLISKDQFLWAYMVINTRIFVFSYKAYLVVSQNKPKKNEINHKLNLKYLQNEWNLMMPVADFVNQLHPTKEDFSDMRSFSLNYRSGYIDLSTSGSFKAGEEYGFLYNPSLSSTSLVTTYGYAVQDNIWEEVLMDIRNALLDSRPESRDIWRSQKCIPEGINFINGILSDEPDTNIKLINFNLRRRDKFDKQMLDFLRIATYNKIFGTKFNEFFDGEKTQDSEEIIDGMFKDTVHFYLDDVRDYGYLTFYSEIKTMELMVMLINHYLSFKPDELPDPDTLPRRMAVCVTAGISQRNMLYHQIRGLKKRIQEMIQTQILNEF